MQRNTTAAAVHDHTNWLTQISLTWSIETPGFLQLTWCDVHYSTYCMDCVWAKWLQKMYPCLIRKSHIVGSTTCTVCATGLGPFDTSGPDFAFAFGWFQTRPDHFCCLVKFPKASILCIDINAVFRINGLKSEGLWNDGKNTCCVMFL